MDIATHSTVFVMYHYCDALATVICNENEKIGPKKMEAIFALNARLQFYIRKKNPSELINSICKKRYELILQAQTVKELQEIMDMKTNYPSYNFSSWKTGPYHLGEEELILWSEFDPGCKMVPYAAERCIGLAKKYLKDF